MKKYQFTVLIEKDEDDIYVATVPAIKGCHTQSKILEELYPRIKEAIELCLEVEEANRREIVQNSFIGIQQMEINI